MSQARASGSCRRGREATLDSRGEREGPKPRRGVALGSIHGAPSEGGAWRSVFLWADLTSPETGAGLWMDSCQGEGCGVGLATADWSLRL